MLEYIFISVSFPTTGNETSSKKETGYWDFGLFSCSVFDVRAAPTFHIMFWPFMRIYFIVIFTYIFYQAYKREALKQKNILFAHIL